MSDNNEIKNEWEIVYHEILAIVDRSIEMTRSKIVSRESDFHHELSEGIAKELQESVKKCLSLLKSMKVQIK